VDRWAVVVIAPEGRLRIEEVQDFLGRARLAEESTLWRHLSSRESDARPALPSRSCAGSSLIVVSRGNRERGTDYTLQPTKKLLQKRSCMNKIVKINLYAMGGVNADLVLF
jgi:hypothetical protein